MKHINIPVFIPHLGCQNDCVFCNQRTISGTVEFDEKRVTEIIDTALSTSAGAECEIAFFGGSFTGIDRDQMIRLLNIAESYVKDGRVTGIRMSTRPDYIDDEIIGILKEYTVTQVELGIQSMSDKILAASHRGHTAKDTENACRLLTDAGFDFVGQMMIGLPLSTVADEIETAMAICDMGCVGSRIYPTIIFKDTALDLMYKNGEYSPLSLEEAVTRSASVLEVFVERGVKCLRIGLCDSENLHSESTYSAGPSDPSIGEAVIGRLFFERVRREAERLAPLDGRTLVVECPRGSVSKIVGNKKDNFLRLQKEFKIKKLKTIEKDDLIGYNIKVSYI